MSALFVFIEVYYVVYALITPALYERQMLFSGCWIAVDLHTSMLDGACSKIRDVFVEV